MAPAASPDEDPTGVRALLSALPEPDPMPEHLVARINASLAAEQTQRAAQTSSHGVTPLLTTRRRRSGRLLYAIAGAAAVALIAVVGSNLFLRSQPAAITSSAAREGFSSAGKASPEAPLSADSKAAAARAPNPSLVQIRSSNTRYTQVGFAVQVRSLRGATLDPNQPDAVKSSDLGPAGTVSGLIECLSTIGAGGAQAVRADVAFYEGRPAVILVATTDGLPVAYAVGRQCSPGDAALLHSGTPLH
jgi:hypothetical protein